MQRSITLFPRVPHTFLPASEEAHLVESKTYFPSFPSGFVKIAFKILFAEVVLSFCLLRSWAESGGGEYFVSSIERES